MKNLIGLLVVAFVASTAIAESLCVATFNLNYANRRGDQVLDAIAKAKPDLICFQETTVQSEQFLRDSLGQTHPYFYSVGHEGRYLAERFALASKTKLSDLRFVSPKAGLFGFYQATVVFNGVPIQVISVHLTPFQLKRGGGVAEAMGSLTATEETHASEIEAVVQVIDTKRPHLILGDFNSLSSFVAPRRLVELGMTDAFASVHKDADTQPTWFWPSRPVPLALRIDYIFHSHHFSTVSSEVLRRDGSDHALIYAVLKLGK